MGYISPGEWFELKVTYKKQARHGPREWRVVRTDKASRKPVLGTYGTKEKAVSKARRLAKKNKPAKLKIEKKNGNTSRRHTYK